MRPLLNMDTIQIEITNACLHECGNCTRFVGHHKKPFFMDMDFFKNAVDSMVQYPKMTGVMGGEPLLHPQFEEMCEYLHSKIPPEKCGLWSCFPEGYEHYREVIVKTFQHVFVNDHTRDDVLHAPILVQPDELPLESWRQWVIIDSCWAQLSWSASINPFGAYFCEIAASLAILMNKQFDKRGEKIAWNVEPGWWTRVPLHFTGQIKEFCSICGCGMPLERRYSVDEIDDISPKWFERIKNTSPKIKAGKYKIHDLQLKDDCRQMASYKDLNYRDRIARRYGMFLEINEMGFWTPYLLRKWKGGENSGQINKTDVSAVG
jgi:hypothetical protein